MTEASSVGSSEGSQHDQSQQTSLSVILDGSEDIAMSLDREGLRVGISGRRVGQIHHLWHRMRKPGDKTNNNENRCFNPETESPAYTGQLITKEILRCGETPVEDGDRSTTPFLHVGFVNPRKMVVARGTKRKAGRAKGSQLHRNGSTLVAITVRTNQMVPAYTPYTEVPTSQHKYYVGIQPDEQARNNDRLKARPCSKEHIFFFEELYGAEGWEWMNKKERSETVAKRVAQLSRKGDNIQETQVISRAASENIQEQEQAPPTSQMVLADNVASAIARETPVQALSDTGNDSSDFSTPVSVQMQHTNPETHGDPEAWSNLIIEKCAVMPKNKIRHYVLHETKRKITRKPLDAVEKSLIILIGEDGRIQNEPEGLPHLCSILRYETFRALSQKVIFKMSEPNHVINFVAMMRTITAGRKPQDWPRMTLMFPLISSSRQVTRSTTISQKDENGDELFAFPQHPQPPFPPSLDPVIEQTDHAHGQDGITGPSVEDLMRALDDLPGQIDTILEMRVPWRDFQALSFYTRPLRENGRRVWVAIRWGGGAWDRMVGDLHRHGHGHWSATYYRLTIAAITDVPCTDLRDVDEEVLAAFHSRGDRGYQCCWTK